MNQLTPPPERDLSARRQAQIRRTLTRHLTPTARPAHPFRTPVLAGGAAVGLAAATMVGYSAWPGGGPADDARQPESSGSSFADPSTDGGSPPADPVRWCHHQLDEAYVTPEEAPDDPDFAQWPLETGPSLQTPDGVVQVLVDEQDQWWWACDSTIAHPYYPLHLKDGTTLPPDNTRWNYALSSANAGTEDELARYFWGAGQVPAEVDSVRFTFPDGHVEAATVADGFWMVRYQAPTDFPDDAKVRVEAGGESFALPLKEDCATATEPGSNPKQLTPMPTCTD